MEFETKETPDLEVIDEGMDPEAPVGPDFACCWGTYSPMLS